MRIVSGLADAGWHDLQESGAYEWWYFDALSEDASTAFVLIWFAGLPFSPDYLTDHERGRGARALDHVAMFAAVYRDGRQLCYALNRHGEAEFDAARDGLAVRIGPNTVSANPDASRIELAVDVPTLFGGSRLAGRLAFEPAAPRSFDFGAVAGAPDHVWNPIAPACAVSGELELLGSGGAPTWSYAFRGTGYHDHNYGTRPLTEGIRRWHWGRAHLGDRTVVFYHTEPDSGPPESVLAVVDAHGPGRCADERVTFDASGWRRRPLCPRFPTRVAIEGGARVTATVRHVLDWGPFYMRFLTDFRLEDGGSTVEGPGISEYLDPRGLRARWLRPLIKTRIRRR